MKKKILVIIAVVCLLVPYNTSLPNAAANSYSETDLFGIDAKDYIPSEIEDIINTEEMEENDNWASLTIGNAIKKLFSDNVININTLLSYPLIVIIIVSLLKRTSFVIGNNATILIKLSIIYIIIKNFHPLTEAITTSINELNKLTTSITPIIGSVSLLGGASFTAAASTASLGLVLNISNQIFSNCFFPLTALSLGIFVTESLSTEFASLGITKSLKKNLVSIIIFSFSFLLAIITLNGILATSKDSASLKGIKFAAANIIPVIGSSVSEAMKTVTAGIATVKSTLGLASACAILTVTLPTLLRLLFFKATLRLLAICASLLSVQEASSILDGSADIVDVMTAVFTAITIIVFFSIFAFTVTLPF